MKKTLTRLATIILSGLMLLFSFTGCSDAGVSEAPDDTGDTEETEYISTDPVTITVAGAWEDCKAIEAVGREFTSKYPNCTVLYEYLQNYESTLIKRMTGEDAVDMFFSNSIQADSEYLPYALDFYECEGLDLSQTYKGLIDNYEYYGGDANAAKKLYALPLGGEMRGLYVNKTLLDSLSIPVPTNQETLLAACEKLKENGYIPFHGNPGAFSQTLLYPWICNTIANADDYQQAYDRVNNRTDGLGEMFNEQFSFLFMLVEKDYYDYKTAQTELGLFIDATDEAYSRYFLNIRANGDTFEKADDIGQVAFMPATLSLKGTVDQIKSDYHSTIEYVFIPAPVGKDGGYIYMSPARAIAVNKNSANLEWTIRFLDFIFQPDNNKLFASEFNVIPNTKDAFSYVSALYDVPENHISQLGQVTFGYQFYSIMVETLVDISKGNNPKYMQGYEEGGANDNLTLYPLDYYVSYFEKGIKGDAD